MSSIGPNSSLRKSYAVAATVSAFHVVGFDTVTSTQNHVRVIHWSTETTHVLGIAQDYADTTSGIFQAVSVISGGYARVAAGASVSAGAILTPVTLTGYAIEAGLGGTFNTGAFSTVGSVIPKTLGVALEKASLTDAVIEVSVLIPNIRVRIA